MFKIPNIITLLRFPLALAFLQENITIRVLAIVLAMITDCLDGYLARKYKLTSRIGTFLDPLADKFFVITALVALLSENRLTAWEAATMLCRDFSIIIFGCYLIYRGTWEHYQFRAIWCGKLTTTLQLSVLFALTLGATIPPAIFSTFVVLGLMALGELYLERKKLRIEGS